MLRDMSTADFVAMSIRATGQISQGRRVALHLDESMQLEPGGGFLPRMNVEGESGYYAFIEPWQQRVAAWFGADYEAARALVEQVNAEHGIDPVTALDIAIDAVFGAGVR